MPNMIVLTYILLEKSFAPLTLISLYFELPTPVKFRKTTDQAKIFRECLMYQASVTKRRGIGPIRTEISLYKIRKNVVYFLNC